MHTEQIEFWAKEYAHDYIEKNGHFDLSSGMEAWSHMLQNAGSISNVLECGSNIGRNIHFMSQFMRDAEVSVIDVCKEALDIAKKHFRLKEVFESSIVDAPVCPNSYDLVFTMGVLILVHPDDLLANMEVMYRASRKYILMGEYFNRTPISIDYHGRTDLLFKRDFGKMFIENFPVRLVDYGFLWGHIYDKAGFDDITWWLFEKQ